MARRERGRGAALVLLLAGACALLALGVPPAEAAGPNTSWAMASDYDHPVLRGASYSYDGGSGIAVEGTSTHIDGNVDGWYFSIEPATGDVLVAGRTYTGATRTPFREPTEPGLELYGHGVGCNTVTGSFTVHELTLDSSGEVASLVLTFEHHCDYFTGPAYASIAWHASTAAPPLPPTKPAPPATPAPPRLRLSVDEKKLTYATRVTLLVRLSGSSPNRQVVVLARTADGQEHPVTTGTVDAEGRLETSAKVTESTTFVARLAGAGGFPDTQDEVAVTVAGKLKVGVIGKSRKQGQAHLFKPSQDAVVASLLKPNHAGDCIKFRVQFQVRGFWGHDVTTKCVKLTRDSVAAVRVPGDPRLVGIPIRVHSEWRGDARNTRAQSTWVYLRFVR